MSGTGGPGTDHQYCKEEVEAFKKEKSGNIGGRRIWIIWKKGYIL